MRPRSPKLPQLPAALARAAVDTLADGVVILARDGGVLHVNPSAEEILERSRERAVGLPVRTLPGGAALGQLAERTMASGETCFLEIPSPRDPSSAIGAEAGPVWDGPTCVGAVIALKVPREGDRPFDLEALAAGLAHEIKNPLAGLQGAAELLAREAEGPQREYALIIAKEAKRVDGLVRELLDLARPAALTATAVNVHEVLDHVLALAKRAPEGQKIAFSKRYDPSLPPVLADSEKLTQVILNLVRNAVDATANSAKPLVALETGVASMRLRAQSGRSRPLARIAVLDNGPGISAEMLHRLFTPFATSKAQGTGLGLAVSRRIILAHGGRIEVRNHPSGGAEAAVYLPLDIA